MTSLPHLTAADRALLRQVFVWGHANGWSYTRSGHDYEFEHPTIGSIDVSDDLQRVAVWYWREHGQHNVSYWPGSVRESVDVLVALGILPAHFSSAFAAGRESLGDLVPTDERPAYRTQLWADDGETWATWSGGRERGTPQFEQGVIADAEKELGRWDATCSVVRTEVQRFREVTYRVDMAVLARFGDWSEVDA